MTVAGLIVLYEFQAAPPFLIKMVIRVKGDYRNLPESRCVASSRWGRVIQKDRLSEPDQSTSFYGFFLPLLFSRILQISQISLEAKLIYIFCTHTKVVFLTQGRRTLQKGVRRLLYFSMLMSYSGGLLFSSL